MGSHGLPTISYLPAANTLVLGGRDDTWLLYLLLHADAPYLSCYAAREFDLGQCAVGVVPSGTDPSSTCEDGYEVSPSLVQ